MPINLGAIALGKVKQLEKELKALRLEFEEVRRQTAPEQVRVPHIQEVKELEGKTPV